MGPGIYGQSNVGHIHVFTDVNPAHRRLDIDLLVLSPFFSFFTLMLQAETTTTAMAAMHRAIAGPVRGSILRI